MIEVIIHTIITTKTTKKNNEINKNNKNKINCFCLQSTPFISYTLILFHSLLLLHSRRLNTVVNLYDFQRLIQCF